MDTRDTAAGAAGEAASLRAGQRLGRYQVVGLLGSGGMGRVYRAHDATLGRDVAIKALAQSFHEDESSLRRFEREARLLAALNHPAIATIHGLELLEGAPYLVLELISGETLLERLARGPLPLPEAIAAATQVAEALEEAHRKGVVHRDLKPSNVMLTAGGRVKVLDFGVAKSVPREAGERDPSHLSTASGTVLGTAPYMSPEQVRGDEIDARSDVWAFGCLLYEMLSGQRAFRGRSVADTLASILRDEVDWSALPADTPRPLRRLMRRCLRRDLQSRLQAIGDARLELSELAGGEDAAPAEPRAGEGGGRWRIAAVAFASLGVAAAVLTPGAAPQRRAGGLRLSLELPAAVALPDEYPAPFAVSADGSRIVLVGVEGGRSRLYLRRMDELALEALPGTEGGRQPFFSPDGRWIGFFADRWLKKVPVTGGPPVALAEVGRNPRGATWAPGGSIVLSPSQTSGLQRVPDQGGAPVALTALDARGDDSSHRWPEMLPDGRWVLFTAGTEDASYDEARLEAVSLESGERRPLLANASYGRVLPDGALLFARAGRLLSVPITPGRLAVRGEAVVVVDGVRYDPRNGSAHLAVSASGALLYAPAAALPPERHLAWLDANGRLSRLLDIPRVFGQPRLNRDGTRVAVRMGGLAAGDLWTLDVASGTLSRLTMGLSPHRPVWRPDGRAVAVAAQQDGRWRLLSVPLAEGEPPSVLLEGPDRLYPNDWTPDGRLLIFQERVGGGPWDLRLLEVDGAGRPAGALRSFAATPANEAKGALSPDGTRLAYESDELDGLFQVYVRSFPDGSERIRVSPAGARSPRWGPDGRLYYWSTTARALEVVRVGQQRGRLVADEARPVLGAEAASVIARLVMASIDGFDIDRKGRFLVLEQGGGAPLPPFARPVVVVRGEPRLGPAS